MEFNENARLDSGQIEDRRGAGGFRGGPGSSRGGFGTPMLVGGGGIGTVILVLVASLLFGVNPLGGQSPTQPSTGAAPGGVQVAGVQQACQTGADANRRGDCRIVAVVNSVQSYWASELPRRGVSYVPSDTVLFSGQTPAGCGLASTADGPFYCPTDRKIYLDLDFFSQLRSQFGARGGPFAESYVVAHEYGHHVEDLLNRLSTGRAGQTGAQGGSVRLELQADCLAGVWAKHAMDTGFVVNLTTQDIADGLDAAASVGDDRIQQQMQGRVAPEAFTHGTSQQRQNWFTNGFQSGSLDRCDTSSGTV